MRAEPEARYRKQTRIKAAQISRDNHDCRSKQATKRAFRQSRSSCLHKRGSKLFAYVHALLTSILTVKVTFAESSLIIRGIKLSF